MLRAPKANRTLRLKRVGMGTGRFTIAQDGVRTVTIKLTKPAIRALRRARTLKAKAVVAVAAPGGKATLTVTITLRAKKVVTR